MIANVDIILKCNKNVFLGQKFIENFDENVRSVTLETYYGEEVTMRCDESHIAVLNNTGEDLVTTYEKEDMVDIFEQMEELKPSKIDLVLLNGYKYRVIVDGEHLKLYNEIKRVIEFTSTPNDLIELLSSIDPNFVAYVKKFNFF